jgi:hypothetical protein
MTTTTIDALKIRRRLGRDTWEPPTEFGPDGWVFLNRSRRQSLIVTAADRDDIEWTHASLAGISELPTYLNLREVHSAVWGEHGYSYQAFVPLALHVNIHPYALHLWGRSDGLPVLPEMSGPIPGFERSI